MDELVKNSRTILLVDDEEIILKLGKKILEQIDCRVFIADTADEAIDILRKNREDIELVFLDVLMPEMEGTDLFLMMQKIKPELKVIFSSGYGVTEPIQKYLDEGKGSFIPKPFTRDEIIKKVEEAFSQ